jgi:hypothetical protein
MFFFWPLAAIVVAALLAGTLAGGVYTLVLIPIAAVALLTLFVSWLWTRATGAASESTTSESVDTANTLPRRRRGPATHAPTSPERIADLRRQQQ